MTQPASLRCALTRSRDLAMVAPGELLASIGSAATVEIAVRGGRADKRLAVGRGALAIPVPVEPAGRGAYR